MKTIIATASKCSNWTAAWLALSTVALISLPAAPVNAAAPTAGSETRDTSYGLAVAKRANCMGCHKWHGDGGPGYGGAAISLRNTKLGRKQLVELIKCGRPGTNMPYFDKTAYKSKRCYGLTFDDFADDADNRPLQGKKYLNDRQVNAVVDFIASELQGKSLTKAYCETYFGGPARQCSSVADADE